MKIEMGESLFYSWLRHVKECQIAQTNWKPSPSWQLRDEDRLQRFMDISREFFQVKYKHDIFKKCSLAQFLRQAEIDAVGLSITDEDIAVHAVDVAFHESGLNYGDRQETVMRVIKKFMRTALCIVGYFGITDGEIIFASPKIHAAVLNDLELSIEDLNRLFQENEPGFKARLIANDDFNDVVLTPILIASEGVSDTSELFMRGYQLIKLFGNDRPQRKQTIRPATSTSDKSNIVSSDILSELKIGKIVQTLLRKALEDGKADDTEIYFLQKADHSKDIFHINYPLLVQAGKEYDPARYYKDLLTIRGQQYLLCNDWYERAANNDRPYLLAWLKKHDVSL
jgi:hypothetical protein